MKVNTYLRKQDKEFWEQEKGPLKLREVGAYIGKIPWKMLNNENFQVVGMAGEGLIFELFLCIVLM